MKTTLICVFTLFSAIACIAQNTPVNYIFGNSQNSTYQSGSFMGLTNNNTPAKYTFSPTLGNHGKRKNSYSPTLAKPIKLNFSIGFYPKTTYINSSVYFTLDSGNNNIGFNLTTCFTCHYTIDKINTIEAISGVVAEIILSNPLGFLQLFSH